MIKQSNLDNASIQNYHLLSCMYEDDYFPNFLVDKCKSILLNLCQRIEKRKPHTLEELYHLTHAATNQLNELEQEFAIHNSEIETVARECLAESFEFIAIAYGFANADLEMLIETREW